MSSSAQELVLVSLLEKDAVPFETLRERNGALLELVHALLGVVPNCDPYLEIWPAAFPPPNEAPPTPTALDSRRT